MNPAEILLPIRVLCEKCSSKLRVRNDIVDDRVRVLVEPCSKCFIEVVEQLIQEIERKFAKLLTDREVT